MRKTLTLALVLWSLVGLAQAANTVPAGQAAVVVAIVGKVNVDQGKGYAKAVLGQQLAPGTTIKTGASGRASLTLPDGSLARIAPNTELNLKHETVRKGIFTRLVKGVARFLVAKQTGGASFETELPNAVAAVKGTDPEYGTDGKTSYAKVFSSGNPVALLFTDTKSGKETSLKAGEKLSFDGDSFKVEKLDPSEEKESDKNYEGLPSPGAEGTPTTGEEGPTPAPTPATDEMKKAQDDLQKATQEAMQQATEELYLDGFLERDDRTGDIASGKIVYDRFGARVQVSHYITRADEDTITISSFSKRDGGPNKGTTSAIETSSFNQALPQDWGKVFRRSLSDPANLDANGYPIYWRTSSDFLAKNPFGDTVGVHTDFFAPDYLGYSFNEGGCCGGALALRAHTQAQAATAPPPTGIIYGPIEQGFNRTLYIDGEAVFNLQISDPFIGDNYANVSDGGIYPQGTWYTTATPLEGGWSFGFNSWNEGPDFLTMDVHLLDDKGAVLQHPFFTGTPATPTVFRGFDANVEVAFRAPQFAGRSIDLVFLPGFFDLYDMFNTDPYDSWGGF